MRLDFCSEIPIFEGVSVWNTIVHFAKAQPEATHEPIRVRRSGKSPRDFNEINSRTLPTASQHQLQRATFNYKQNKIALFAIDTVPLSHLCYISKGLLAHAEEKKYRGEFTVEDCLSETSDATHPKRFVQGKDLLKWVPWRIWYLEWGTSRAPSRYSRSTFNEFQEAHSKLLVMKNSGRELRAIYDDSKTFFDATIIGVVPWYELKHIRNTSIRKKARYRNEFKSGEEVSSPTRDELELLSDKFNLKYLAAIVNSTFATSWVLPGRRHSVSVYPDDLILLPIACIPLADQQPLIDLVDHILNEFKTYEHPLPSAAAARVAAWEQEIDAKVYEIYGIAPDDVGAIAAAAPTDLDETDDEDEEA